MSLAIDTLDLPFELDSKIFSPVNRNIDEIVHCSEFKLKEQRGELLPEPLLTPDQTRFVLFPIKHADVSVLQFEV